MSLSFAFLRNKHNLTAIFNVSLSEADKCLVPITTGLHIIACNYNKYFHNINFLSHLTLRCRIKTN